MGKAQNSWIVGLVKCKECGHAVNIDKHIKKSGKIFRYNVDYGWSTIESCVGRSYPINKAETLEEALEEPLKNWNKMTIQQQHDIAATIIDCVYISHNSEEIEIKFSI